MNPTNLLPSAVLTVLQAQLSTLAEKIDRKLSHLDLRVCKLACRVHELGEELVGTNNTRSRVQHMNSSRKRKRYNEVDKSRGQLAEYVEDASLIISSICEPIKQVIQQLDIISMHSDEVAVHLIRVGSDTRVARAVLASNEVQPLFDHVHWGTLTPSLQNSLMHKFVKTIAKKIEHTKRKVKKRASDVLLKSVKFGKTDTPFTNDILHRLRNQFGEDEDTVDGTSTSSTFQDQRTLDSSSPSQPACGRVNTASDSRDECGWRPCYNDLPASFFSTNPINGSALLSVCDKWFGS